MAACLPSGSAGTGAAAQRRAPRCWPQAPARASHLGARSGQARASIWRARTCPSMAGLCVATCARCRCTSARSALQPAGHQPAAACAPPGTAQHARVSPGSLVSRHSRRASSGLHRRIRLGLAGGQLARPRAEEAWLVQEDFCETRGGRAEQQSEQRQPAPQPAGQGCARGLPGATSPARTGP